ncbi:pilus assembly protein CpaB [Dongia mobilis]|uniref:Pilus assembly protein CpaB n=1 Tax=Dongia mobilis TaxID=578943 RepID=A0A4R6WQW8_9PROT|nr:Flp pilus assembly protein CpaB [Dongia mobilis]TDQ78952.1 pilus assembly protein CpaB [Dongia mobilis]
MRPIVIILIVVALGAAGLTAFLAMRFLSDLQLQQQQQATPTEAVGGVEEVLVAARDIGPGEILAEADLRWEQWPKAVIDQRFTVKAAAGEDPLAPFRDTMTRRAVMLGEPVTAAMVIKQGDAGMTSAVLAPGMRSVTVEVSARSGAAGLILPGDHVDIMLITNARDLAGVPETTGRDAISRYAAEAIMRDVKVIAVNQLLAKEPGTGPGINSQTVTFEVTAEQAQKIMVASQLGSIVLSLRGWARDEVAAEADAKAPLYVTDREVSRVLDELMQGGLDSGIYEMPVVETEDVVETPGLPQVMSVRSIRINRGGAVSIQNIGQ